MNQDLVQFVRRALSKGSTRQDIGAALLQAGWADTDIKSALATFAEISFPVPVPKPRPYLSAREVFLYIVMFSSLYDCCYNVGSVIFDIINKFLPDMSQDNSYWQRGFQDSVRWSVAHLIVAFPLFLFTFRLINRAIARNPAIRASKPRKWLTYLTLLLATLGLACDVGTLIYNLLGGELTLRFILKFATVAFISGGVFLYFLRDMRREEQE